jgi:hypothetical protein
MKVQQNRSATSCAECHKIIDEGERCIFIFMQYIGWTCVYLKLHVRCAPEFIQRMVRLLSLEKKNVFRSKVVET